MSARSAWRLPVRGLLLCLSLATQAEAVQEGTYSIRLQGDVANLPARVCVVAPGKVVQDEAEAAFRVSKDIRVADLRREKQSWQGDRECFAEFAPEAFEVACADQDGKAKGAIDGSNVLVLGLSVEVIDTLLQTVSKVEYTGSVVTLTIEHESKYWQGEKVSLAAGLNVTVRGGGYQASLTFSTDHGGLDVPLRPRCEVKLAQLPSAVGIEQVVLTETTAEKGFEWSSDWVGNSPAPVKLHAATTALPRKAEFVMTDRGVVRAKGVWTEGTRWSPESHTLTSFWVRWAIPDRFPEDSDCPTMIPVGRSDECERLPRREGDGYCQYECEGKDLSGLPTQVRMSTGYATWLDEITAINQTLRTFASPAPIYVDFHSWKFYVDRGHKRDHIEFVELRLPSGGTHRVPVRYDRGRAAIVSPDLEGQSMIHYRPVGDRPYQWEWAKVDHGVVKLQEPQPRADLNVLLGLGGGLAATESFDYNPASPYFEFTVGMRFRPRYSRFFFDFRGTYLLLNQPYDSVSLEQKDAANASLSNRFIPFSAAGWWAMSKGLDLGAGAEFGFSTPVELDNAERIPFRPMGGPVVMLKWSRRRALAAGVQARIHFTDVREFDGGDFSGQPIATDRAHWQVLGGLILMAEPWTFTE